MNDVPINSDYSEIVQYNNPDFPAYIKKGLLSTYPNYRATCHWHDDLEFIYIYEGTMNYYVNGSTVCLNAGQGIFVNSHCLHYGFSDKKEECSFLCILLHPDLLSSNEYFVKTILNPLFQNEDLPYLYLTKALIWQADILDSLADLYNKLEKENEALEIIQSFTNIVYSIINNASSIYLQTYNQSELDTLSLMVGYVQQHYTERITTSDLIKIGRCCKTKCNNLFREYLNTSPIQYITNYRLDKSIGLLSGTTLSITEIAYQCGFGTASYFCETFNKNYGITPKQYRSSLG